MAQFYIASLLLVLEYLHNNCIVYRDLKPENVVVGSDGYLKLVDMGTCKHLPKHFSKTFTIIGTPIYMAPEIIVGKGYSYSADLWSLGVMLYEFIFGDVPYGRNCDDIYSIYSEIVTSNI